MITKLLITTILAAAGIWAAEKWVLTTGADGDGGFVQITPGFGMDDIAQALTVAVVIAFGAGLVGKFFRKAA